MPLEPAMSPFQTAVLNAAVAAAQHVQHASRHELHPGPCTCWYKWLHYACLTFAPAAAAAGQQGCKPLTPVVEGPLLADLCLLRQKP